MDRRTFKFIGWLLLGLGGVLLELQDGKALLAEKADKQDVKLCDSTTEFIATFEFLRKNGGAGMKDEVARGVADHVARGCDGASTRFEETYGLLTKMGVSQIKSLEMSIEFSRLDSDIQKNFFEILKHSYLSEFFDYDFDVALRIAFEFSRDLKGNHVRARDDFISLVKFCLDKNNMALPANVCGLMALDLVRLSPYFPMGIFKPFTEFYEKLRVGESYGLSVRDTIEVVMRVLKYGPRSPDNFNRAYDYALSEKGLRARPREALLFALRMARRSATGQPLPLAKGEDSELMVERARKK